MAVTKDEMVDWCKLLYPNALLQTLL
jgi:hypothetical protein